MGDLTTCGDVLLNYLEAYEFIPWDDLRYMFGEVFYGGHITDDMDRRCCTTYLEVKASFSLVIRPGTEGAGKNSQANEVHFITQCGEFIPTCKVFRDTRCQLRGCAAANDMICCQCITCNLAASTTCCVCHNP